MNEKPEIMTGIIKKARAFFFVMAFVSMALINSGCILDDKTKDYSEPNSTSFTNLTEDTILLYIDGKLETQIFSKTVYWVELPSAHHTYAALEKASRQEIMSGEFNQGDKINIMRKP